MEATKVRTIEVIFNKKKINLSDREMTGREIKEEAIRQGVEIAPDFQLSVRHGNRLDVVDDDEEIRIRHHQEFICVKADDNS
ncbi:multiubiquitin domain-containing protein [Catellatospora sp. NPDC049609]|uniref:multiubiquitin domain-containing protein n=1 Tax=Catellatospora sp. NPDC049609 TaxID=3155505 RepID=UPI003435DEEB